jgi:hypothetical protein
VAGPRNQSGGDVAALGRSVFTTYLFAFEVTAALLVIAVVGAVVLSRQIKGISSDSGATEDTDGSDDGEIGTEDEPPAVSELDETSDEAVDNGEAEEADESEEART